MKKYFGLLFLLITIFLVNTAEAKSLKKGEVYRLDNLSRGYPTIEVISSSEVEITEQGHTFVAEYEFKGDKLRVVVNFMGTKQVQYYLLTEQGLKDEKTGDVYYTKAALRGSAKSEAKSNLQVLLMLLDTYYSDNAKYAPSAGTYTWSNDASGTITEGGPFNFSTWLPSFQPKRATGGTAANYNYSLTVATVTSTADSFTATASPRSGTVVANSGDLTINKAGAKTGW